MWDRGRPGYLHPQLIPRPIYINPLLNRLLHPAYSHMLRATRRLGSSPRLYIDFSNPTSEFTLRLLIKEMKTPSFSFCLDLQKDLP